MLPVRDLLKIHRKILRSRKKKSSEIPEIENDRYAACGIWRANIPSRTGIINDRTLPAAVSARTCPRNPSRSRRRLRVLLRRRPRAPHSGNAAVQAFEAPPPVPALGQAPEQVLQEGRVVELPSRLNSRLAPTWLASAYRLNSL